MRLNRQMKRRQQKQPPLQPKAEKPVVAIAWFDEAQYAKLLEVAVDRDSLHDTHEAWLQAARSLISKLPSDVVCAPVQVDELMAWCQERGLPNNGSARSQYACDWARKFSG